jgi:hypothetical protein
MEDLPPKEGNFDTSLRQKESGRSRRKRKSWKDDEIEHYRHNHRHHQNSRRTSNRRNIQRRSHSLSSSISEKERNASKRKSSRLRYDYSSTDDDSTRRSQRRQPQLPRRSPYSSDRKRCLHHPDPKMDESDDCEGDYSYQDKKKKRKKSDYSLNRNNKHCRTPTQSHSHRRNHRCREESPRRRRDDNLIRRWRREEEEKICEKRGWERRSRRSSTSSPERRFHHGGREERRVNRRRRSHSWNEERYGMRGHRYDHDHQDEQHRRDEHRQRMDPPVHGAHAGVVSDDDDGGINRHTDSKALVRDGLFPAAAPDSAARSCKTSPSCYDDSSGHYEGRKGSMIADRYRVVKEVGVGTFGRVLECVDLKHRRTSQDIHHRKDQQRDSSRTQREGVVAIKVVRNVKRYHESAIIEANIVRDVNRRGGRGLSHCAIMYDAFSFHGHYCMVFESLGPSLYDYLKRRKYRPFPVSCVRHFAQQLLETLEFLHSFNIIHTDLKLENLLLLNDSEVSYRGGQMIPKSTRIKVIDFGGATYDDEKKSSIVNTRQYRAPEVILGIEWSMPSDLWSVGKEVDMVAFVIVILRLINSLFLRYIPFASLSVIQDAS